MQNKNQDMNQKQNQNTQENSEKLHRKIKETWSGLSDSDVKLYDENREEFFAKLKEKNNISKEDAQKTLQQLEKDCGCASTAQAA